MNVGCKISFDCICPPLKILKCSHEYYTKNYFTTPFKLSVFPKYVLLFYFISLLT